MNRPPNRPGPRARKPTGPATIAPSTPTSPARRRELLKATYHRLGRLAKVPVATLVAADADGLMAIANGVPPGDGRPGDARRLVLKVLRLRADAKD